MDGRWFSNGPWPPDLTIGLRTASAIRLGGWRLGLLSLSSQQAVLAPQAFVLPWMYRISRHVKMSNRSRNVYLRNLLPPFRTCRVQCDRVSDNRQSRWREESLSKGPSWFSRRPLHHKDFPSATTVGLRALCASLYTFGKCPSNTPFPGATSSCHYLRAALAATRRTRTVFRVRKCYDVATRMPRIRMTTLFHDNRPFATAAAIWTQKNSPLPFSLTGHFLVVELDRQHGGTITPQGKSR